MLEKILFKKEIYAIILRKKYKSSGIKFFTPNKFSQQLAYMKRPKGYVIKPHIHKKVKKEIKFTQEVLFIRSGKVKVEFFNNKKIFIKSKILNEGDIVLLSKGGHGFKILQECEIIEVKQGPYDPKSDKIRFNPLKKKLKNK